MDIKHPHILLMLIIKLVPKGKEAHADSFSVCLPIYLAVIFQHLSIPPADFSRIW